MSEPVLLDGIEVRTVVEERDMKIHFGHQLGQREGTMTAADDVEIVLKA
jgi:hypothetical protein